MSSPLRRVERRGAVQALDTAFWLYRERFLPCFFLSFAAALAVALVDRLFKGLIPGWFPPGLVREGAESLAELVAWCLATPASASGIVHVAYGSLLGERWRLRSALADVGRSYASVLVAGLLAVALIAGVTAPLAVLAIKLGAPFWAPPSMAWVVLGVLVVTAATLTAGILAWLPFALALPVVVVEGAGAWASMGRSRRLTRGGRRRILGATWLYLLLATIVTLGVSALMALVPGEGSWKADIESLLDQIAPSLASPLFYLALTVIYFDARVDHEALDTAVAAARAAPPAVPGLTRRR